MLHSIAPSSQRISELERCLSACREKLDTATARLNKVGVAWYEGTVQWWRMFLLVSPAVCGREQGATD